MNSSRPKTLTLQNTGQFFNTRVVSSSSVKKGSLIQFNYSSPEGIHDKKPLVFVMENKGDRIIGLNLHYQLGVLGQLVQMKDEQLKEFMENTSEYKKYMKDSEDTTTEDLQEGPDLPNPVDVKAKQTTFDERRVRYPQVLLEDFTNEQVNASEEIFRVYLFKRMSGLTKLVIKT
jgi:hypothetical protein